MAPRKNLDGPSKIGPFGRLLSKVRNVAFTTLALGNAVVSTAACDDSEEAGFLEENGDGDGEPTGDGDGDGEPTGDGDGDGEPTGDGDGDTTETGDGDTGTEGNGDGDGDGDTTETGDGDTGTEGDGDGSPEEMPEAIIDMESIDVGCEAEENGVHICDKTLEKVFSFEATGLIIDASYVIIMNGSLIGGIYKSGDKYSFKYTLNNGHAKITIIGNGKEILTIKNIFAI